MIFAEIENENIFHFHFRCPVRHRPHDPILAMLRSDPTKPDQSGLGPTNLDRAQSNPIGLIGSPILVMLPIWAMASSDLRIDIFPKNAENANF